MTVKELVDLNIMQIVNLGSQLDKAIQKPFCCDLLSLAIGKAQEDSAWVTVMGNINTLAVAVMAEVACVILAEGVELDQVASAKAAAEGIMVFKTEQPVFDIAYIIQKILDKEAKKECSD